ncbi:MAG: hypothetical protein ABIE22_03690 [archaeon]
MDEIFFSELEKTIFFLALHFFKEHPESCLAEEAILDLEEEVVYNSSFSQLFYDFGNLRIETMICDEDYRIFVYEGEVYGDDITFDNRSKILFSLAHYVDGSSPDQVEFVGGDWIGKLKEEYVERR